MIFSALAFAAALQAAIESPGDAFGRAEELYREERFLEAAQVYESIRERGVEDGTLYYNLGNAYFKAGRLGLAVLSYERALKLMPADEDARVNLAFARELVAKDAEPPPLPLLVGFLVELYRTARPSVLASMVSIAVLLAGVAWTVVLLDRWPRLRGPAIATLTGCGFVALVAGTVLVAKLHAERTRIEAVVISENAYVRSGPTESSPRLAEIHEGLKVRVLGEREGFLQISLASGLTGWIPKGQVERI